MSAGVTCGFGGRDDEEPHGNFTTLKNAYEGGAAGRVLRARQGVELVVTDIGCMALGGSYSHGHIAQPGVDAGVGRHRGAHVDADGRSVDELRA